MDEPVVPIVARSMCCGTNRSPGLAGPAPGDSPTHRPGREPVVWRLTDGKAGHEAQSQGLLQALERHQPLKVYHLPIARDWHPLLWALGRFFPPGEDLPAPHWLVGAGRGTHLALLAAQRARGGRTVVLMNPGFWRSWFDLCLIPAHDRLPPATNIHLTRGALTTLSPGGEHYPQQELILVGGPSHHYGWDLSDLLRQLKALVLASPSHHFRLTTSRRTPPEALAVFRQSLPTITVIPWQHTGPGWMREQLAQAGQVWVTADSVSMVYEALTSGAAVGVLAVPPLGSKISRVAWGLEQLVKDGLVTPFAAWQAGQPLKPPSEIFDEADRIARWLVQTGWLQQ